MSRCILSVNLLLLLLFTSSCVTTYKLGVSDKVSKDQIVEDLLQVTGKSTLYTVLPGVLKGKLDERVLRQFPARYRENFLMISEVEPLRDVHRFFSRPENRKVLDAVGRSFLNAGFKMMKNDELEIPKYVDLVRISYMRSIYGGGFGPFMGLDRVNQFVDKFSVGIEEIIGESYPAEAALIRGKLYSRAAPEFYSRFFSTDKSSWASFASNIVDEDIVSTAELERMAKFFESGPGQKFIEWENEAADMTIAPIAKQLGRAYAEANKEQLTATAK